jgi:hypothetical protein
MNATARLKTIRWHLVLRAALLQLLLVGCGREPGAAESRPAPKITWPARSTMTFTAEGADFAPVLVVEGKPEILWTWSDGTTSSSATPQKSFGSAGSRTHALLVKPWSAVRRINLGYDAGDGGSDAIEHVPDQHVSAVAGLELVAPTLQQWCSSYNQLTSLDFSNFVNLDTVECFLSRTLKTVTLTNTPQLKRACFEDCDLRRLDLSQCPRLEDLRGAQNAYSSIVFGRIGASVWHICVRDNPQMTDQSLFADMSRFPGISELFIWNDNQAGKLRIPASSPDRPVALMADGNHFTSVDLSGALRNAGSSGSLSFRNNQLASLTITGCVQITEMNLEQNRLSAGQIESLLATLDGLGRSRDNSDPGAPLRVDLRGNAGLSSAAQATAAKLAAKGWTIVAEDMTAQPPPPPDTGEVRIDFVTRGPATRLRCDFSIPATATWHWSDGTTSPAGSGEDAVKETLGDGDHPGFLVVSNGSALTRFGAADGGGQGNLTSISGLERAPQLAILYAYNENALVTLSRTSATKIREYHLLGTGLSPAAQDQVFADAVATGVRRGHLWCGSGTDASKADRATLAEREWTLEH